MTSIQTPVGGWQHEREKAKPPAPIKPKTEWWERLVPDGRHGLGWQLVALALMPITAWFLVLYVYGRGLLKGGEL